MSNYKRTIKIRNSKGQGLIQGSLAMVMMGATVSGAALMLLNMGMSIHYKQRIAFMAKQVAEAEAAQLSWGGSYNAVSDSRLQNDATIRMNELLQNSGLTGQATVIASQTPTTVTVDVAVSNLPVFGEGTLIPNLVTIKDRSTITLSASRPPGTLTLSVTGRPDQAVSIPCYGFFRTPFSNGATNFSTNAPPAGVAAFRSLPSPAGYSQFVLSVPSGSASSDAAQNDTVVFAGGYTPG
ncbi:MAG: hypothetical protein K2W82_13680 [Candidatus Obscuribacterales bacterium]|nr:hypothetical protein [Candidatus Obscuribacterales bacterium]